jgi:tryptophanyl-tRNA synthetase
MSTILSGIQPSGALHLGNYLGALQQWVALQGKHTTFYCIVDLHAITVPYDPAQLPEQILHIAALYLAAGLDPEQSTVFLQSHVPAHTELAWLLSTQTPYGELTRMTQFKDKSAKQATHTTLGLFSYPVLQAADILLYRPNFIPVGEDQVQHIELARSLAKRFNSKFGEIFTLPAAKLNPATARIMSLTDPTKKMSKSDSPKSYLGLTDSPADLKKKIMSAVTETEPVFSFSKSGPAVKNLLTIYRAITNEEPAAIEQEFTGKSYREFKQTLAATLIEHLAPLQERYREIRQDDDELRVTLAAGAEKAKLVANHTLGQVKQAMGLL